MSAEREPFAPSPRPPLPWSTEFVSIARNCAELAACARRAENSTRTYFRCGDDRCWRWLFMPAKPPLVDEQP